MSKDVRIEFLEEIRFSHEFQGKQLGSGCLFSTEMRVLYKMNENVEFPSPPITFKYDFFCASRLGENWYSSLLIVRKKPVPIAVIFIIFLEHKEINIQTNATHGLILEEAYCELSWAIYEKFRESHNLRLPALTSEFRIHVERAMDYSVAEAFFEKLKQAEEIPSDFFI